LAADGVQILTISGATLGGPGDAGRHLVRQSF
jgi:hypothetical protein